MRDLQRDLLSLSSEAQLVYLDADHMGMLLHHDEARATAATVETFLARLSP